MILQLSRTPSVVWIVAAAALAAAAVKVVTFLILGR
jgi:hypothetical protein